VSLIPEIKAEWVAALRSGDYNQGQRRLVTLQEGVAPKYCCLGVLCHLIEEKGEYNLKHSDEPFRVVYFVGESEDEGETRDASVDVLPRSLAESLGLDTSPEVPFSATLKEDARIRQASLALNGNLPLAYLNDKGFTFEEIADLIEASTL
jgi:hypothetical protein